MSNEPRNTPVWPDGSLRRPLKSLDAQQSLGAGTAYKLGRPASRFGIEYFRGTTSATNESTSASIQLQGQIASTGTWLSLGAAITVNSATPVVARSTNALPVHRVRVNIASFTTSAGAASTGENKIPITAWITTDDVSS